MHHIILNNLAHCIAYPCYFTKHIVNVRYRRINIHPLFSLPNYSLVHYTIPLYLNMHTEISHVVPLSRWRENFCNLLLMTYNKILKPIIP